MILPVFFACCVRTMRQPLYPYKMAGPAESSGPRLGWCQSDCLLANLSSSVPLHRARNSPHTSIGFHSRLSSLSVARSVRAVTPEADAHCSKITSKPASQSSSYSSRAPRSLICFTSLSCSLAHYSLVYTSTHTYVRLVAHTHSLALYIYIYEYMCVLYEFVECIYNKIEVWRDCVPWYACCSSVRTRLVIVVTAQCSACVHGNSHSRLQRCPSLRATIVSRVVVFGNRHWRSRRDTLRADQHIIGT